MWKGKAERLAPLIKLCSRNQPWKWTDTEQNTFEDIKETVAKNTLLIMSCSSYKGSVVVVLSKAVVNGFVSFPPTPPLPSHPQ
eukprot:7020401-Ditylum_brightwellii.AAC.1